MWRTPTVPGKGSQPAHRRKSPPHFHIKSILMQPVVRSSLALWRVLQHNKLLLHHNLSVLPFFLPPTCSSIRNIEAPIDGTSTPGVPRSSASHLCQTNSVTTRGHRVPLTRLLLKVFQLDYFSVTLFHVLAIHALLHLPLGEYDLHT